MPDGTTSQPGIQYSSRGREFHVRIPFDATIVAELKRMPGRRFDALGKFWALPARTHAESKLVLALAQRFRIRFDRAAIEHLAELRVISAERAAVAVTRTPQAAAAPVRTAPARPATPSAEPGFGRRQIFAQQVEYEAVIRSSFDVDVAIARAAVSARAALESEPASDPAARVVLRAPEGLAYLPHQVEGIQFIARHPGALVADEPGLGKTVEAVGVSNALPWIRRVLIICPASLKLNWAEEWRTWDVKQLRVDIVDGGAPACWPDDGAQVVIINFDLCARHRARLHERQWDIVIVDEAHSLKDPGAERTQVILGDTGKPKPDATEAPIAGIPTRRWLHLTGTPILNRPVEIWPLLRSLAPEAFESFWGFVNRYCAAKKDSMGWHFDGATHLEELHRLLRSTVMIRRRKADVLKDLPPKRRQIIRIAGGSIVAREQAALALMRKRLEDQRAAVAAAAERAELDAEHQATYKAAVEQLQQVTFNSLGEIVKLRKITAFAKLPSCLELVETALESGKILVFAHHHEVIDAVRAHFGAKGIGVAGIDGRMPNAARQAEVKRFQSDPECRLFIAGIRAAGVGHTLTAASHVIFLELDWVPGIMCQAEDRAHRIGQLDSVLVWHVVVDGSIDAAMAKSLVRKQSVIDRAVDGASRLPARGVCRDDVETGEVVDEEALGIAFAGVSPGAARERLIRA